MYLCHQQKQVSVERQLSFRKLSDSDSDFASQMCQDLLVGLGAPERISGEAHNYGIATEELCYSYAGDANCARDDSDLTVRQTQAGCLESLPIL